MELRARIDIRARSSSQSSPISAWLGQTIMEVRMHGLARTLLIAGAMSAVSWLAARWFERRRTAVATAPRAVEQWENEGGALAPQPGFAQAQDY